MKYFHNLSQFISLRVVESVIIAALLATLVMPAGHVFAVDNTITTNNLGWRITERVVSPGPEYVSKVYETNRDYSGIASMWQSEKTSLYIRSFDNMEAAGEWIAVENATYDSPDSSIRAHGAIGEVITVLPTRQFQFKITGDQAPQQVQFDLFAYQAPQSHSARVAALDSAGYGPNILTRSEWGANESKMTWESEYAEAKAIIIHHTAADDSRIMGVDGRDAVKNIYQGHAVTYGWGDIGYNYIVDLEGKIYEGRAGGNGVIGGHTLGYNPGLIGISVVGNYDTRSVSDQQNQSLIDLIAYLSYKNRIDPTAMVQLKSKFVPTVIGHQDLNATSCPGNSLYGRLGEFRAKVAEKLATYPVKTYRAQVSTQDSTLGMFAGQKKKIRVNMVNTGNVALLGYGVHAVQFVPTSGSELAPQVVPIGASIEAGRSKTIELEITAPSQNNTYTLSGKFIVDGVAIHENTLSTTVAVTIPPYAASINTTNTNHSLAAGATTQAWVEIKNIGQNTWEATDGWRLVPVSNAANFYTNDWIDRSNVGGFDNYPISPGQTGRISFGLTAPNVAGTYNEKFILQATKNLEGGPYEVPVSVVAITPTTPGTPPSPGSPAVSTNPGDYQTEVIAKSNDGSLQLGETRTVSVEFKNTGKASWPAGSVRLGTVQPRNRDSQFADSSWKSAQRVEMSQLSVAPGQIGRFSFTVKAPSTPQSTIETMQLVAEGVAWFGPQLSWAWNVQAPTLEGRLISQSPYITTSPGFPATLTAKFKNTGNIAWERNTIRLATTGPDDRISRFQSVGWLSGNRIEFQETRVAPGEVATFILPLKTSVPNGVYREGFQLIQEGVGRFGTRGMYWNITVQPAFDAFSYVSQTPNQAIVAGQSAPMYLEVKNTGTTIWQKSGSNPIRLATNRVRDRVSPFLTSNRIVMDRETVAPGETVRFSFTATAPQVPGIYKEYFTLVKDGERWMKDIGIYFQWTVLPNLVTPSPLPPVTPDVPAPAPTFEKSIQVQSTGPFIIVRGGGQQVTSGAKDDLVEVGYANGIYAVKHNGSTYSSSDYVRLVPQSTSTYFALTQYQDRPTWNPTLNDNVFKGVLEVRYAPKTKKLWAINELHLEDYLKGVSESIDTFDFEYLKVSAIIQRSYVLHHFRLGGRHKDDFLTLKNSRNGNGDDQIYQGYNFTKRASNISRAVDATRGEIVTYQGKPVITPYYTQSDGRTRSASEVWNFKQSDYPWLTSVPDPGSQGLSLMGHGVGLPGRGARDLIRQGKSYKETLQYFYTGTDTTIVDEKDVNVRVGIYSVNY